MCAGDPGCARGDGKIGVFRPPWKPLSLISALGVGERTGYFNSPVEALVFHLRGIAHSRAEIPGS